jgi:hypothetical protein
MSLQQTVGTQIKGACTEASTFLKYGHPTRTHLVMGDWEWLLADSCRISNTMRKHSGQLLDLVELITFGRLKYLQLSHYYLRLVTFLQADTAAAKMNRY